MFDLQFASSILIPFENKDYNVKKKKLKAKIS